LALSGSTHSETIFGGDWGSKRSLMGISPRCGSICETSMRKRLEIRYETIRYGKRRSQQQHKQPADLAARIQF
jgi:hypothetical protein